MITLYKSPQTKSIVTGVYIYLLSSGCYLEKIYGKGYG